mgnify:FL=1
MILVFSTFYGHCTSLEAEARALLEGLAVCAALGHIQVLVEMDSKILLDAV